MELYFGVFVGLMLIISAIYIWGAIHIYPYKICHIQPLARILHLLLAGVAAVSLVCAVACLSLRVCSKHV